MPPAALLDEIRQCLPAVEVYSYQETPPDWLPAKLAAADTVWVTEDSVSMTYEALSSGARVGLLPAPRLMPSARVLRGLEELAADGFLTTFAGWQQTHQLYAPPTTLREADRCAAEVIGRLFEQRIRLAGVEPGP